MPSPKPASTKLSATRPQPSGRSKPRVNSDDPDVANASYSGSIPVPQKIAVNPTVIERDPHRGEQDEGERRVEGEDAVTSLIGACRSGERGEQTADAPEVEAGERDLRGARHDHGLDRRRQRPQHEQRAGDEHRDPTDEHVARLAHSVEGLRPPTAPRRGRRLRQRPTDITGPTEASPPW